MQVFTYLRVWVSGGFNREEQCLRIEARLRSLIYTASLLLEFD